MGTGGYATGELEHFWAKRSEQDRHRFAWDI
jgi:hypothetical protein